MDIRANRRLLSESFFIKVKPCRRISLGPEAQGDVDPPVMSPLLISIRTYCLVRQPDRFLLSTHPLQIKQPRRRARQSRNELPPSHRLSPSYGSIAYRNRGCRRTDYQRSIPAPPKLPAPPHPSSPGLSPRVNPCAKKRTASRLRGSTPAAIPVFWLPCFRCRSLPPPAIVRPRNMGTIQVLPNGPAIRREAYVNTPFLARRR
jgi:hypothetical protein